MAEETTSFMAMKGAGYYSRATIGAKHVMDNAAGLVLEALFTLLSPLWTTLAVIAMLLFAGSEVMAR